MAGTCPGSGDDGLPDGNGGIGETGNVYRSAGCDEATALEHVARAIDGQGSRLLRFKFLRGDYSRVRRVTVRLGDSNDGKDVIAA